MFDKKILKKALDNAKVSPPRFYMGVDEYDKNALSYCLMREFNGTIEVVLAKTMRDKVLFDQEVENLAKYFEALSFKET